ncbi:hypothetical protein CJJ17_06855 [Gordonia polyisoprenivorans]|nr:hypothetical protein CJJ17_06855 [Gordonia polyisoprenivorans]
MKTPTVPEGTFMTIPARCRNGHELTARTAHVARTHAKGWECVRCLRAACWRAHTGTEPPESILDETKFHRQAGSGNRGWWARVKFESGWGFTDPDPTPKLREKRAREEAAEQDKAEAAERARIARELDEIELRDARQRVAQRRKEAEQATAAIRAAMSAARGGVAC